MLGVLLGRVIDELRLRIDLHEYPRDYAEYVERAAEDYGVPENILYAVIHTESSFRSDAVSPKGAIGLMQLMPDTYDWICFLRRKDAEPAPDLTDPAVNIDAGAYLLHYLYEKFSDWETVYAAYNAGYARVNAWLEDESVSENGKLVNIPYPETQEYVRKVSRACEKYAALYGDSSE